ncbi:hypothetical protein EDD28_2272 [Salana multivorans]|uniref:Uncharacterized protein n=1 Tax=Salana multivorans TaxID=120377 RepID=A0A3N2DCZ8_9MICO|nr:hypothetical protein EDD28_2272 [Salana multivorans]
MSVGVADARRDLTALPRDPEMFTLLTFDRARDVIRADDNA